MGSWHIRKTIRLLRQGAVIAYPTETVWGFGCLPEFEKSLTRILDIKQRPVDKGVILVGTDLADFSRWIAPLSQQHHRTIGQPKKRPTTWIVPASAHCPYWISGGRDTLAIRISDHPLIQGVCNEVGPLVSTSANKAGKPTKLNRSECLMAFGRSVDWVTPGTSGSNSQPSKIIELITGKVLRD